MNLNKMTGISLTFLAAALFVGCAENGSPGEPGFDDKVASSAEAETPSALKEGAAAALEEDESALEGSGAALAPAFTPDNFEVCGPSCPGGRTKGTITWGNRQADISGFVEDHGAGSTTAIFDAFAGSTLIDHETRTADDSLANPNPNPRPIGFPIGDPNLVGGINKIVIQVCFNIASPPPCGAPKTFLRL